MASKKLRPGSFKGGKGPVRRTGRTTGISQSAFAGYGFQPNQQAEPPPEKSAKEAADDAADNEVSQTEDDQAPSVPAGPSKGLSEGKADQAGNSAE